MSQSVLLGLGLKYIPVCNIRVRVLSGLFLRSGLRYYVTSCGVEFGGHFMVLIRHDTYSS